MKLVVLGLLMVGFSACSSTESSLCSAYKECYASDYAEEYGDDDSKCEDEVKADLAKYEKKSEACGEAAQESYDCEASLSCEEAEKDGNCKTEDAAFEKACSRGDEDSE